MSLTYLFPIQTKLTNNENHWYLIILQQNMFVVWDSLWSTQTKREKEWDRVVIE